MNDMFMKTFSKANKVKKIKMLINNGYRRVSFVSKVDHSSSGRPAHAVLLEGIALSETASGDWIITGIDVELSAIKEITETGRVSKRWFNIKNRKYVVYRSFRVDNILDGSISF